MLRHGFRAKGARVQLKLESVEREVVADLLAQLQALVTGPEPDEGQDPLAAQVGIADSAERPSDPALLRLFPDAYREDDAAATDFRRFTEATLRRQKADNARIARETLSGDGSTISMTPAEAQAWMLALNDLRLTIGTQLGVTQERPAGGGAESDMLYDWLTWLQSTCIDALTAVPPRLR